MADRRTEILATATELFARQGIRATTVRQIGQGSGVLSGSLYHHFASKAEIVDAVLSEFCTRMVESYRSIADAEGSPTDRFRGLIRYGFSLVGSDHDVVLIFQNEARTLTRDPEFTYLRTTQDDVEKIWQGVIDEGIATGDFHADLDAKVFYRLVRDTVAGSVHWYRGDGAKSIDEIADLVADILLDGARNSTAAGR